MVAKYTSDFEIFNKFEKNLQTKKTFVSKWLKGKSFRAIGQELNMSQTAVMNNFWREVSSYPIYEEMEKRIGELSSEYMYLDFSNFKYGKLYSLVAKKKFNLFIVGKTFVSREKEKITPLISSLQEEIQKKGLPFFFERNKEIGFSDKIGFLNHEEANLRYKIQGIDSKLYITKIIPREMKKRK